MKALILYGGWDGHEPDKVAAIYESELKAAKFKVERVPSLDPLADLAALQKLDLIIINWTMGQITQPQWEGLSKAVQSGVGLAGTHGGMGDTFRGHCGYQMMVGGQFCDHPGGRITYKVFIVDHADPIMAGMNHFDVTSEQYYMHTDPSNHVLATTPVTFNGATMPVVWKRAYGKGRVFYNSVGHNAADFDIPEVRTITTRGMIWAAEGKKLAT
jgi:type 1 glutamine amidotransferase